MKIELTMKGELIVSSESQIECYALERWIKESVGRSHDEHVDIVRSGTFLIKNQNGNDMIDQVTGLKNEKI